MRLIDDAEHIDITMPINNLTKYGDNFILILQEVYDSLKETK